MVRGKYAARASNRLANLDNELLQKAIVERDALKAERDHLNKQVQDLTREGEALAMRKAGELAASEIERMRAQMRELEKANADAIEKLAFDTFRFLGKEKGARFDPKALDDLARMFGMGNRIGELVFQEVPSARRARRSTIKQARRFDSEYKQVESTGGAINKPDVAL